MTGPPTSTLHETERKTIDDAAKSLFRGKAVALGKTAGTNAPRAPDRLMAVCLDKVENLPHYDQETAWRALERDNRTFHEVTLTTLEDFYESVLNKAINSYSYKIDGFLMYKRKSPPTGTLMAIPGDFGVEKFLLYMRNPSIL